MKKNLLKKILVIGLALAVMTGMAGCGSEKEETAQSEPQTEAVQEEGGEVSAETDAQQIALSDAGLTAEQVAGMKVEIEGGLYEIEFIDQKTNVEYGYEIDEDGKILEKTLEFRGVDLSGNNISESEAADVALKDAGFTKENVINLSSVMDEGEFDVRFADQATGDEYDYELAANGAILEKSIEYGAIDVSAESQKKKDFNKDAAIEKALKAAKTDQSGVSGLQAEAEDGKFEVEFIKNDNGAEYSFEYGKDGSLLEKGVDFNRTADPGAATLSQEDAIAKAADFLGMDQQTVANGTVRQDTDDGETIYEIEFKTSDWYYEVDVHGKNGKVLEWSKDRI